MGKIGLVITLGTRDIQVDINKAKETFKEKFPQNHFRDDGNLISPRSGGQFILDNYESIKKSLVFPIIEPAIKRLSGKFADTLTDILLVATNQENNQYLLKHFIERDTINYAYILKKSSSLLFKRHLKQIGKIEISTIARHPNNLDLMYDFFNDSMDSHPFSIMQGKSQIFLLNQGGIDAITTSIMLTFLNRFDKKISILSVDEKNSTCLELNFSHKYLAEFKRSRLQNSLENYHFQIIENFNLPSNISALANYAKYRLNFDFAAANQAITDHSDKDLVEKLQYELNQIQQNPFELLREVYLNAKVKFEQAAYIDFLSRLFRLTEGLPQYFVCKELNIKFDIKTWAETFEERLKEYNELKEFLTNARIYGSPVDLNRLPSRPVWLKILEFFESKENYANVLDIVKRVSVLADLRNQSIGAHGFDPVSLNLIENTLNNQGLTTTRMFQELDKIFEFNSHPYREIKNLILSEFNAM